MGPKVLVVEPKVEEFRELSGKGVSNEEPKLDCEKIDSVRL